MGIGQYNFTNYRANNTGSDGLEDHRLGDICKDADGKYWFGYYWFPGITIYDGINWETIYELDGVNLGVVHDLLLDSQNNIWIVSLNGINTPGVRILKYDGFTVTDCSTPDLSGYFGGDLIEDKFQNIWMSGASGIARFDGTDWVEFEHENGVQTEYYPMACDTLGQIWVQRGFSPNDVIMFDGLNWTSFEDEVTDDVRDIHIDHNNVIWVCTTSGVMTYDGVNWSDYPLINESVSGIEHDENGTMYFSDGLYPYDGTNGLYTVTNNVLSSFNTSNSDIISNDIKRIIKVDNEIWLLQSEFDSGFCSYVNGVFTQYISNGLGGRYVHTMYQDYNHGYYFGTNCGASYLNNGIWTNYPDDYGSNALHGGQIYAINQHQPDQVFFQTNFGLNILQNDYWTVDNTLLPDNYNQKNYIIFRDRLNNLWFGSGRGVSMYNGSWKTDHLFPNGYYSTPDGPQQIQHYIYAIDEDPSGIIYVGDLEYGLRIFDGEEWYLNENILNINSIHCDSEENLWLGTKSGLMQIKNTDTTVYTQQEGLLSDTILSVLVDDEKRLWVGTWLGLNMLDSLGIWHSFDTLNDALSGYINDIYQDVYDNVWFCTSNGVVKLTPSVNEGNEIDVVLFPNPCTEKLSFKTNVDNFTLRIFDLLGRQVYDTHHIENYGQFNSQNLQIGSYILRIDKDSKTVSKSFIKIE